MKSKTASTTTTLHEEVATGTVPTFTSTGKVAKDTTKVTALLPSGLTFTGTGLTGTVTVTAGAVGKVTGTLDIGNASKSVGLKGPTKTTFAEAKMNYWINGLEQRKLKIEKSSLKLGAVLRGANIGSRADGYYNAITKNKTPESATFVTTATTPLTLGANTLSVGTQTITGTSDVKLGVSGRLNSYAVKWAAKGEIGVTTAEASTVGDTAAYKNLKVAVAANVGIANKIAKTDDFAKATVLNATVNEGEKMGSYHVEGGKFVSDYSLSSKVAKSESVAMGLAFETLAVPSLVTKNAKGKVSPSGLKNLFGIVGSEAEIVASNVRTSVGTDAGVISMQWRMRNANESRGKTLSGVLPTDSSAKWLTSDVVKISGTTASDIYALQMTFDNRINVAFEGTDNGSIDKQWQSLYIGQLTGGKWTKAATGPLSAVGHYSDATSLDAFLAANSTKTLAELEGSWGVDKAAQKSWAIVRGGGSGIFAVVPEPATIVMILSATLGAMTYGWRRWSRKSSETVA